jgi:hypothetical protein
MKDIIKWLKNFLILLSLIMFVILICLVVIFVCIIFKMEYWKIFVSILAGTGLFFAVYISFNEYRKDR